MVHSAPEASPPHLGHTCKRRHVMLFCSLRVAWRVSLALLSHSKINLLGQVGSCMSSLWSSSSFLYHKNMYNRVAAKLEFRSGPKIQPQPIPACSWSKP